MVSREHRQGGTTNAAVGACAARVRALLRRHLHVEEARLAGKASLVDDLGADSVALVEFTLALEEEFEIDISDEEAERMRTVADVVEFVERRASERRGDGARM